MQQTIDRMPVSGAGDWDDAFDRMSSDAELYANGIDTLALRPVNWGPVINDLRGHRQRVAPVMGGFTVQRAEYHIN